MKNSCKRCSSAAFIIVWSLYSVLPAYACSTFMLKKDKVLIYAHNLNQPGIDVPGMIFINKRGIFKRGRTWNELFTKNRSNPSDYYWISRYGSVTFNAFGRDFPDGGMNETGLYIWEMSEQADYPQNDSLPKLMHMNWMQYILDNTSSLDEAINCASQFEIDGWGWHYFIGDGQGNCASVAFKDGEIIIHRGDRMPVPALFNEPYERELELLKYFQGFGGQYNPDLQDKKVPRFVKTAVMIRDFDLGQDAVEFTVKALENLTVNEPPKWSVIFDVYQKDVYFKTEKNPGLKYFSMKQFDFSNRFPVKILDINPSRQAGEVSDLFREYSTAHMENFLQSLPLPDDFFTRGGLTKDEFVNRFAKHHLSVNEPESQFFSGTWKTTMPANERDDSQIQWELKLWCENEAVWGNISNSKGYVTNTPIEHLQLRNYTLSFTYRTDTQQTMVEAIANIDGEHMQLNLNGIESRIGSYDLFRVKH